MPIKYNYSAPTPTTSEIILQDVLSLTTREVKYIDTTLGDYTFEEGDEEKLLVLKNNSVKLRFPTDVMPQGSELNVFLCPDHKIGNQAFDVSNITPVGDYTNFKPFTIAIIRQTEENEWVITYETSAQFTTSAISSAIPIKNSTQLFDVEFDSTKVYIVENPIEKPAGKFIIVPEGGLTLKGYGINISSIISNITNEPIFISPPGGCGNLNLSGLTLTSPAVGSQVFDITDKDGSHEISLASVNFENCNSLGTIYNFRQGTMDDGGIYGCADGIQLSGAWNGFKISNTNVFGFGAAGTLFKKAIDTTFANRLFLNLNLSFPTGAKLIDFVPENFLAKELLQINSTIVKVNGVINSDIANTIIPNLSANDEKCLWIGNIGLPDSATENFVDAEIEGDFEIDWLKDTYFLRMNGDTTFSEKNLPADGKNTAEIKIYLTGEYIPEFLENWLLNAVGTYKGTDINEISLKFIKTGVYFMKINNSLTVYPKPSLQSLLPTSLLPGSTSGLTINGSFFTPETIVKIKNAIVNSVEFVNQGQLVLSVTTSEVEEDVDITISNGTTVVFAGVLPVNLGVVYIPVESEWEAPTGSPFDLAINGTAKITVFGASHSNKWSQELDYTKDFRVDFSVKSSSLGSPKSNYNEYQVPHFSLNKVSDNNPVMYFNWRRSDEDSFDYYTYFPDGNYLAHDYNIFLNPPRPTPDDAIALIQAMKFSFRWIAGIAYFYRDNTLIRTSVTAIEENLKIAVSLKAFDITNIKYIELPE